MDSAQLLKKYQEHLIKQGLSPATVERKLSSVRNYLGFLEKRGLPGFFEVVKTDPRKSASYQRKSTPVKIEELRGKLESLGIKVPPQEPSFFSQLLFVRAVKSAGHRLKSATATVSSVAKNIPHLRYQIPYHLKYSRPKWLITYQRHPLSRHLNLAIVIVFAIALGIGGYEQFFKRPPKEGQILGTIPTSSPAYLSFQGRLTDTAGTPITTATNFRFSIYNSSTASGSAQLYEEMKTIVPDQDGIFNTLIGDTTVLPRTLFKDNADLWLGVTVSTNAEMTDRQQIATVAYAFNSQYLQGYAVASATSADPTSTAAAEINTVPVINPSGNLVIAAASPSIRSTSGVFKLDAQVLYLTTAGNGNINLDPGGTGTINLLSETTTGNAVNATSSALTTGNLFYGGVSNDNTGFKLLRLQSGATLTDKFYVDASGNTYLAGNVGIGTTDTSAAKLTVSGQVKITGGSPAANKVLTSDANGLANWQTIGSASIDDDSLDFTKFMDSMTLDAGTTVAFGNYDYIFNLTGTGDFRIQDNGTDVLFINDSGNVGIGTITPGTAKFAVMGGNVGIGTTGPLTGLVLNTGSALFQTSHDTISSVTAWTSPSGSPEGLFLSYDATNNRGRIASIETATAYRDLIVDAANLYLNTGTATPVTAMTINSSGNVGIGTTSPGAKLDVWGNTLIGNSGGVGTPGTLTIWGGGNATELTLNGAGAGTKALAIQDFANAGSHTITAQNGYLEVDTYSSNALVLNATSGNVGIGTVGPDRKLDILDASNPQLRLSQADGTVYADFQMNSDGDLVMNVDGVSNQLVLDNGGNVGIGTTSPSQKLDVQGNVNIGGTMNMNNQIILNIGNAGTDFDTGGGLTLAGDLRLNNNQILNSAGTATILFSSTPTTSWNTLDAGSWLIQNSALGTVGKAALTIDQFMVNQDIFTASASGSTKLVLNYNGNLGIGNSSPQNKLDVVGSASIGSVQTQSLPQSNMLYVSGNVGIGTTNPDTLLSLQKSFVAYTEVDMQKWGTQNSTYNLKLTNYNSAAGVDWRFIQTNGATTYNPLTFSAGNVGIGTTSPSRVFDVESSVAAGNVLAEFVSTGTNANAYSIVDIVQNSAADSIAMLRFDNDGDWWSIGNDGKNSDAFTISDSGAGTFSSPRFTINQSGNVGIGTTSPVEKLDVNGAIKVGTTSSTCGASYRGAIKFVAGGAGVADHLYVCEKNSLDAYTWVAVGSHIGGFAYRSPVTINNTGNANTLTNYQVSVTVNTASLITAGKMQTDCDDIRFTDLDGQAGLSYWLESGCNSASTKVWVKVPSIAASSTKTIYIYYGNPGASSGSDGDATFEFFDDFPGSSLDTTKWEDQGGGTVSVASSVLSLTGSGTDRGKIASITYQSGNNHAIAARTSVVNTSYSALLLVLQTDKGHTSSFDRPTNGWWGELYTDFGIYRAVTTTVSGTVYAEDPWPDTSYHIIEFRKAGSNLYLLKDGVQKHSRSDTTTFTSKYVSLMSRETAYRTDVDWTYVRQFIPTEPTTSVGTEQSGDIAEWIKYNPSSPKPQPGEVVCVSQIEGSVEKCQLPNDPKIMGVVSTTPYLTMREDLAGEDAIRLALSGRVPVKVSTENGSIKTGDYLTSSSTPGVAAKAVNPGRVIGVALESYDPLTSSGQVGEEVGEVTVFLNPHWYGGVLLTDTGDLFINNQNATYSGILTGGTIEAQSEELRAKSYSVKLKTGETIETIANFAQTATAKLKAGLVETTNLITGVLIAENKIISPKIETGELTADGARFTRINTDYISPVSENLVISLSNLSDLSNLGEEATESGKESFGKLLVQGENNETVFSLDAAGNASFSGNVAIGNIGEGASRPEIPALSVYGNASISGELVAESARIKKLRAENIEGLDAYFSTLSAQYINNDLGNLEEEASESADLTGLASTWLITDPSNDIKITTNVTILGVTSLAQTIVSGPITQDGTLLLDEGNSINALSGTLYLQNKKFGGIDLLAGKVTIDPTGNAVFEGDLTVKGALFASTIKPNPDSGEIVFDLSNLSDLSNLGKGVPEASSSGFGKLLAKGVNNETVFSLDASGSARFAGNLTASQAEFNSVKIIREAIAAEPNLSGVIESTASAGLAKIVIGAKEITVQSPFLTEKSLIYLTPVGSTDNQVLYLARTNPEEKTFTAAIDQITTKEILFSWWIVN